MPCGGKSVRHVELPLDEFAKFNEDLAIVYKWLNEFGQDADLAASRSMCPDMLRFEAWIRRCSRFMDEDASPLSMLSDCIAVFCIGHAFENAPPLDGQLIARI